MEVAHRHGMRVVPAASRRTGGKLEAAPAMRRYEWRTLFLRSVHFRRNEHAMPMHELRRIGVIYNVDGDRLSFPHAQHGAGRGVVITDGRENVGAVEFDGN